MELKNVSKDIRAAFEQNFLDYRDTVPHLFHHNALAVLASGVDAKIGSVTSRFEHFHEWKRLAEDQPGGTPAAPLDKDLSKITIDTPISVLGLTSFRLSIM
jgi:DNA phosphorothioation-dependent restriction protein DptG